MKYQTHCHYCDESHTVKAGLNAVEYRCESCGELNAAVLCRLPFGMMLVSIPHDWHIREREFSSLEAYIRHCRNVRQTWLKPRRSAV